MYFIKYLEPMKTNSTLIIVTILAALGLVTAIAVEIMLTAQEAEARGYNRSVAFNASKGRWFHPDPASELTAADENQDVDDNEENDSEDDDEDGENQEG